MPTIQDFTAAGQSIWYDYLRRSFITSGDMQALIDQGLRGITSNPSIFEAAMEGSVEYDGDMKRLFAQNKSAGEVFETLMLDDVAKAADLLRPVYDSLGRADGYVSVEVNPRFARDTSAMVEQARRFFYKLDRPNVMVTIPATDEGIPAVRTLVGEGINVDITLVFSIEQYRAVVEAYMEGLEELASKGGDLGKVASVASFFVSRVDTAVDRELEKVGDESLQGKIAIANAKVVYAEFKKAFSGERWRLLEAKGARIQRPLWASTSTKKPSYPDTLYVDSLIGEGTVNTVPPATLQAVLDHGRAVPGAVEDGLDDARRDLERLSRLGLDLDALTRRLQADGLTAFAKSLDMLLSSIERRRKEFVAESPREFAFLGEYGAVIDASLKKLAASDIIHRIWTHDYSIWKPEPTEISNRLDWLHTPGDNARTPTAVQRAGRRGALRGLHPRGAPRDGRLEPRARRLRGRLRRDDEGDTEAERPRQYRPGHDHGCGQGTRTQGDALHRLIQVRGHRRDTLADEVLLRARLRGGGREEGGRAVRGDNRPWEQPRRCRGEERVPGRDPQRPEHRREVFRHLLRRAGTGGPARGRHRQAGRAGDELGERL